VADDKRLGIYLDDDLRASVQAGRHNFFDKLTIAFQQQGFQVDLYPNLPQERAKSADRKGYSLFHLEVPTHDRVLDVRLAYMYPFWRIERAQWREQYRVSTHDFMPGDIDADEANRFFRQRNRRLRAKGPWPEFDQKDFVFVALQGHLQTRRHGQSMTPIEMVQATLDNDRFRKIIIKLHPSEIHTTHELAALQPFRDQPRIEFSSAPAPSLLAACEYVVTQNSTVAFEAIFHRKPSILFAESDFHHICQNVNKIGVDLAFRNILSKRHSYARYAYWFLQLNGINAGRSEAGAQVLDNCREFGWCI